MRQEFKELDDDEELFGLEKLFQGTCPSCKDSQGFEFDFIPDNYEKTGYICNSCETHIDLDLIENCNR